MGFVGSVMIDANDAHAPSNILIKPLVSECLCCESAYINFHFACSH